MVNPIQDGLTHKSAYSPAKRLKRGVKRLLGRWERPGYDVQILFQNNQPRFKKVTTNSPERAKSIYSNLDEFRDSGRFPVPVELQHRSVIVDFLKGSQPVVGDTAIPGKLADFYAVVFQRRPQRLDTANSPVWEEFETNLQALEEMNILAAQDCGRLREHAEKLAPTQIWVGYDYTDPILPNLLICESTQRICGIDIKNLHAGQPLGIGLAKARYRWLAVSFLDGIFEQIRQAGAPDVEPYFGFLVLFEHVRRVTRMHQRNQRLLGGRWLALRGRPRMKFDDFVDG